MEKNGGEEKGKLEYENGEGGMFWENSIETHHTSESTSYHFWLPFCFLFFCVLKLQAYTVIHWQQRYMFGKQHFAYPNLLNTV